ncbi:iron-siderophore ABC transporter substrate-binding protein [Azorhizobium sp. AG788]|uniref:iron-siderophore ABC transporter substrate-binding protein n=1 Tax=Azorhizobium sp. AG788 TaxID=2183897 RepID=UPI003138A6EB
MKGLTRRTLCTGLAASVAGAVVRAGARDRSAVRVAAIDCAMLETALAIGSEVVAAAELRLYRQMVVEPAPPPTVADLGLRGSLNYEALLLATPDLILTAPWYVKYEANLSRIAPTRSFRIDQRGRSPYQPAVAAARELGRLTGREAAAENLIIAVAAEIDAQRERLAARQGEAFSIINIGDPRHFRVFGADSMHGHVLDRLGLRNAWAGQTRYSAQAPVDLVSLASAGDAGIIIVQPIPSDALRVLPESPLWNALPAVAGGRVHVIDPVNPFGGLPTARRFARLVGNALA